MTSSSPRLREKLTASIDCTKLDRVGVGAHGWTFCTPVSKFNHVVFSVGIGSDITWDEEMIEKYSTQHHGWDPTPVPVEFFKHHPKPKDFIFHRFGLGAVNGNVTLKVAKGDKDNLSIMERESLAVDGTVLSYPILTLGSMMARTRHEWLSILKIDIEGLEFDVLESWHKSMSSIPADQVLIEFHERFFRSNPRRDQLVAQAIMKLADLGFDLICHAKWVREAHLLYYIVLSLPP